MYKGYVITTFLILLIQECFMYSDECNYICDIDGCDTFTKKPYDNLSSIKFCTNKDVPADINFTLIKHKNDISEFPATLQLNFKAPEAMCKYKVILSANESINEKQCMNYIFKTFDDREIHTMNIICFVSTDKRHQDNVNISFPYIFTACYAVHFCFGTGKIITNNTFLKTNYIRTEISKPMLECSYDIVPTSIRNNSLNLQVNFSTIIVKNIVLQLGLFYNIKGSRSCYTNDKELKNISQNFNVLEEHVENRHHNFNTNLDISGKYEVSGKFEVRQIKQNIDYCFKILFIDTRCARGTLWKPPVKKCAWSQQCRNLTNYEQFQFQLNIDTDMNSSSFLPIIIITLLTLFGIIYLIYIVHTCNMCKKSCYINICNTKPKHFNCSQCNVHKFKNNKKKIKYEDTVTIHTDIVLLYPKGCKSFMALMTDFREMLCKVCRCVVHDWYNGVEWNYVAEIGASEWFTEMLYKKYRIIWIDTPTMRSLIARRFKTYSFLKNCEQQNVEIGDFRDVVFPTIFNLAKRNIEEGALHQSKHFIVRLKGFDNFKIENDPFIVLSLHTRYYIPQDLNLLCSDLSVLQSDKAVLSMNQEEELIEQYLNNIKSDRCK